MSRKNLPLDGVTVIDLGQVYQGPYCTLLMAKAGANVIKVEPLIGEPIRHRVHVSQGAAIPFAMLNANKKAMTLNLKSPRGIEILKDLVRQGDVLLENYAPGVMDKLGVGWSVLSEINPRLIYASGSGYGLTGPDRNNLAMDVTVQAASGMMSVTGFPDGPPVKCGPAVVDFLSGIHLYGGIMTALYERTFTGKGRLVEVAMQETVYPTLASNLAFVYDKGIAPPRTGNRHGGLSSAPYNVYPTSDGYIAIIGINETHWANLLEAIGRTDLTGDPRFSTREARVRNIDATDQLIRDWTSQHTGGSHGDLPQVQGPVGAGPRPRRGHQRCAHARARHAGMDRPSAVRPDRRAQQPFAAARHRSAAQRSVADARPAHLRDPVRHARPGGC